ncbi:hypothetical protein JMUB7507_26380 [Staphylococcus aureus]
MTRLVTTKLFKDAMLLISLYLSVVSRESGVAIIYIFLFINFKKVPSRVSAEIMAEV